MKGAYKLALLLAAGLLVIVLAYYISDETPAPPQGPSESSVTADSASPDAETATEPEPEPTSPSVAATPTPPTAQPATTTDPFYEQLRATLAAAQPATTTANQPAQTTGTPTEPAAPPSGPAQANNPLTVDGPTSASPNIAPAPTTPTAGTTPPPTTTSSAGSTTTPAASIAAAGAQQTRAAATPRPTTPTPTANAGATPATPTPTAATSGGTPVTYTIKSGDTFASIAERLLGNERRWVDIAQANPLVDPAKLKVGQVIRLPGPATEAPRRDAVEQRTGTTPAAGVVYTIEAGDTLSGIAGQFYNDPDLWTVIYEANRDVIKNPDNIPLGRQIRVPPAPRGAR